MTSSKAWTSEVGFLRRFLAPWRGPSQCDTCHGEGKIHEPRKFGGVLVDVVLQCPKCRGTGRILYG